MAQQGPKMVRVPSSIWKGLEIPTAGRVALLWLWIEAGCKPGIVQFRPIDLSHGIGRQDLRQVAKLIRMLEQAELLKVHSRTRVMTTAELADPDLVAFGVQKKKRKREIPAAILDHPTMSAEAKLSWIEIWNENGCQPGEIRLHLANLAATLGKDHPRGARRWWAALRQYGYATELDNDDGQLTVDMHHPDHAGEIEAKILLEEAKRKKKKAG